MANIDLWTPRKTFVYGIVAGGGATYLGMHFIPRVIEKTSERIGETLARRLKAGSNPDCGGSDITTLYNRLLSTLDRVDSRLDNLEKTVYQKGG